MRLVVGDLLNVLILCMCSVYTAMNCTTASLRVCCWCARTEYGWCIQSGIALDSIGLASHWPCVTGLVV